MKKQGKNLLVIMLCAGMSVGMFGCGKDENKNHTQNVDSETITMSGEDIDEMEAQEELQECLEEEGVQEVVSRGYLVIGCRANAKRMCVYNEKTAHYEGFEADLAYHMAASIFGVTYEEAVEKNLVHFEVVTDGNWQAMASSGKVDYVISGVCGSYVDTDKYVASPPYYTEKVGVMAAKATGELEDTAESKIGVLKGANIEKILATYASSTLLGENPVLVEYEDAVVAKKALEAGEILGFCATQSVLEGQLSDGYLIDANYLGEQNCSMITKTGGRGLARLSSVLMNQYSANHLLEELQTKWALN